MDKIVQAVGTLLLIGVLVLALMIYSNTTGIAPVLNEIKAGVNQLVGWLVPTKYSVTITAINGTKVSGANTVTLNAKTAGTYPIASIDISTDKPLKVVIEASSTNTTSFTVDISKQNAIVVKEVEQIGTNSYLIKLQIFPAYEPPAGVANVNVTSYQTSVTVKITATVSKAPAFVVVKVSQATYI